PAGEDDASGGARLEGSDRRRRRHDLRVDLQLAQAPRDQLRVLRAEVEDDDGVAVHGMGRGSRRPGLYLAPRRGPDRNSGVACACGRAGPRCYSHGLGMRALLPSFLAVTVLATTLCGCRHRPPVTPRPLFPMTAIWTRPVPATVEGP